MSDVVTEPRAECYRCWKPARLCVCTRFTPVANRTGVIVLQHPRERFHPLGTARFVGLGLANGRVEVAGGPARTLHRPLALPPGTGLLFPSPEARDLGSVPAADRPAHLVVLDGTWPQARNLYRENAWLAELPHFVLTPARPSNYRIRREPKETYLSTIESVVAALRILEPDTPGLEGLLAAFDGMIDDQIAHARSPLRGRRTKRARELRRFHRVPRAFAEDADRLVLLYAEGGPPPNPRELVHLVALRLRTGEAFERFVRPRGPLPTVCQLGYMGLEARDFEEGIAPERLAAELAAFLTPEDRLAAWNATTPDLLRAATGVDREVALLKPAYRMVQGPSCGPLDAVVEALGLPLAPTPFRGRASRRIANAWAAADFLRRVSEKPV